MDKYLKKLSNNLSFLSIEEKEKVINKYKQIIEGYISDGLSTKDALSKIGSIDDIVKDICKSYNLNYNYCMRKNNLDKDITNISNVIAEFIRDVILAISKFASNKSSVKVLQNILRVIVLVVLFMILKIPFIVMEELLYKINEVLFYPFYTVFNFTVSSISCIIYFLLCIILTLKVFGNCTLKENIKSNKEIDIKDKYTWLEVLIRFIIYLVILIPLLILIIVSSLLLAGLMIIILNGVVIIGLPIIVIGIISLLSALYKIVKDNLNHKTNAYIGMIIISISLIMIGIIVSVINYNSYTKTNDLGKSHAKSITDEINIELDEPETLLAVGENNYILITDETLEGNNIRIEVTYYDEYVDIFYKQDKMDDVNYLSINSKLDDKLNYEVIVKNLIIDLKNKYAVNYSNVYKFNLKIYANKELKEKLEEYNNIN